MNHIDFDWAKLQKFKRAYQTARNAGAESFTFEGQQILVAYAKYMLQYLESQGFQPPSGRSPKGFSAFYPPQLRTADSSLESFLVEHEFLRGPDGHWYRHWRNSHINVYILGDHARFHWVDPAENSLDLLESYELPELEDEAIGALILLMEQAERLDRTGFKPRQLRSSFHRW